LFISAAVTGEVLRMMDCGKQAAKLTILSCWFRVPTIAEWEAETNITNSAVLLNSLLVVVVVRQRYFAGNTGNRGLLECCKWWYYDDVVRSSPAAPIAGATTAQTAWQYVASKTNYTFFFFLALGNFIDVARSGRIY
jgi:hypothetical protein